MSLHGAYLSSSFEAPLPTSAHKLCDCASCASGHETPKKFVTFAAIMTREEAAAGFAGLTTLQHKLQYQLQAALRTSLQVPKAVANTDSVRKHLDKALKSLDVSVDLDKLEGSVQQQLQQPRQQGTKQNGCATSDVSPAKAVDGASKKKRGKEQPDTIHQHHQQQQQQTMAKLSNSQKKRAVKQARSAARLAEQLAAAGVEFPNDAGYYQLVKLKQRHAAAVANGVARVAVEPAKKEAKRENERHKAPSAAGRDPPVGEAAQAAPVPTGDPAGALQGRPKKKRKNDPSSAAEKGTPATTEQRKKRRKAHTKTASSEAVVGEAVAQPAHTQPTKRSKKHSSITGAIAVDEKTVEAPALVTQPTSSQQQQQQQQHAGKKNKAGPGDGDSKARHHKRQTRPSVQ